MVQKPGAAAYLDDLVIHSYTQEDHLHQICAKPRKCQFAMSKCVKWMMMAQTTLLHIIIKNFFHERSSTRLWRKSAWL